jgi:hypothetical protein
MQSIDRWRKWTPERKRNIEDSLEVELTKPTKPDSVSFVSAIPYQAPIIASASAVLADPTGMPAEDPVYWREDFTKWKQEQCIQRSGYQDCGGVGPLYVNFCEWTVLHKSVPCMRLTFEQLLRGAALFVANGMVRGLVLREDLWGIRTTKPTTHVNK